METYKLGTLCRIASSKRIFESEYVDEGIPFVRGLEITDGRLFEPNAKFDCYISKERYEELKAKYGIPVAGDILITAVGTIGNLAYLPRNIEFYFKDGNLIWFSNFVEKVDSKYLYFFMKSPFFYKQINYSLIGAVQKALTMDLLSKIEIPLPDLPTQKKIADVLSCIDNKIALNNKTNTELENMAKTIYDYWFTQFDFPDKNGHPYKTSGGQMVYNELLKREIPAGWEVKRLNDFGEFKNGINYDPEEIGDTKVKIINVRNITESTVFFSPEKFDELLLKAKDIQKYLTDDNDIFIARSGTPGATRLLPPDQKNTIFCGFIIRFKVFEKIKKNFLFFSIKQFENQTNTQAAGTILKNVSQDTLKDIYLFEPPAYVLQTFNSEISTIFNLQLKTKNENEELTKLRDYLLPLLMNGQIEVK